MLRSYHSTQCTPIIELFLERPRKVERVYATNKNDLIVFLEVVIFPQIECA